MEFISALRQKLVVKPKLIYQELLAKFSDLSEREVDGTKFFEARGLNA